MKIYEVSIEKGILNMSKQISNLYFKKLDEAKRCLKEEAKKLEKDTIIYLLEYDNEDMTMANVIDYIEIDKALKILNEL